MSKKQPFEPKQVRQLLRSVFQNVDFIRKLPLLTFHKDQMLGCIYVEPADRLSLIDGYMDNIDDADYVGQDDNVTFMMPNDYEFVCDEAKPFKFELGYGCVDDYTKKHPSFWKVLIQYWSLSILMKLWVLSNATSNQSKWMIPSILISILKTIMYCKNTVID